MRRGSGEDLKVETWIVAVKELALLHREFRLERARSNAAGRPVIAFRAGGCLDTVVEDVTGLAFAEQTPESLAAAVEAERRLRWDSRVIRRHAERYDTPVSRRRVAVVVEERVA